MRVISGRIILGDSGTIGFAIILISSFELFEMGILLSECMSGFFKNFLLFSNMEVSSCVSILLYGFGWRWSGHNLVFHLVIRNSISLIPSAKI